MADTATKLPIKGAEKAATPQRGLSLFDNLRSEIDRLFDDFSPSLWHRPFAGMSFEKPFSTIASPAVDLVEKDGGYEITAELPGLDTSNIDVKIADGVLTIRGEKQESKEEKEKEYHLSERRYGAVQRSFQLPASVDASKIEASFANGLLTVKLPKSEQARNNERKIAIKTA
ncbi:Hsp20/alpha crystallin family protein [Rhizobium sp. BK376]|uniref:Hsp20/alpha crystallin family protein n=1 Tax=Rhizobium sp. BK376 TaxID=2512149 RepID=UPI00104A38FD|nr:Hsp20/alpha crystallin family protein [Rhizobium sp. BK376]TCR76713.1 heat shock protein Hsp20 [Rhizobium sp. BK376]